MREFGAPAIPSGTVRAPALWGPRLALLRLARRIGAMRERARQRRVLEALDDHQLRDLGLSRAEALREAWRPFWR
ncbi:DUF1127 domain-containing protein [Inquilinus limosus]|uniref:DUF1127 domain-containing protein n=1 Tax=Inquilinus limosus TaxID=171674 RepID=UPI003F139F22